MFSDTFKAIFWISAKKVHMTLDASQLCFLGMMEEILNNDWQGVQDYQFWVPTREYNHRAVEPVEASVVEISIRRSGYNEWRVE